MKKPIKKTEEEIQVMRDAAKIHTEIIEKVKKLIRPGVTTWELNELAEDECERRNVIPAFKGYGGFPAALCTSLNNEVVHGIPSKETVLKEGDILSLDFGLYYKGYYTDAAFTVGIGSIAQEAQKLINVTKEALNLGMKQARAGAYTGDIGAAIQTYVESHGFSVVRDCIGHGVGQKLHEPPEVPNYGEKGRGTRLEENVTIAIEPIVNIGDFKVKTLKDQWTIVTQDQSLSAHFEHTVRIKKGGCEIII